MHSLRTYRNWSVALCLALMFACTGCSDTSDVTFYEGNEHALQQHMHEVEQEEMAQHQKQSEGTSPQSPARNN